MTPIFLAVRNAAGETDHVLLPSAKPFASTYLPNDYKGNIDLSVFRNEAHSTIRLRMFEDYVMLSALLDAPHPVYIQLPSGGQIAMPKSTKSDTNWVVLLDGAQFSYAALRCTVEFDHDHSISNSMRPPDIPRPADHASSFSENDLLSEWLSKGPNNLELSNDNEVPVETTQPSSTAHIEVRGSPPDKEKSISEKFLNGKALPKRPPLNLNLKPPPPQATNEIEPLHGRDPNQAPCSNSESAASKCNKDTATQSLSACESDTVEVQYLQEDERQDTPASSVGRVAQLRNPGEQSQALHANNPNQNATLKRQLGQESQILSTTRMERGSNVSRQLGEESQVLHEDGANYLAPVARQAGEESQSLPEVSVIGSKRIAREQGSVTKVQATSTTAVKQILEEETKTPTVKKVSFDVPVKCPKPGARTAVSVRDARAVPMTKLKSAATPTPAQEETVPKVRRSEQLSVESPGILASSIPRKRSVSDMFGSQSSPYKNQSRRASSSSEGENCFTDASTVSDTASNDGNGPNKRRRSLRTSAVMLSLPDQPVIVFSSTCEIQKKKLAMKTFSELGGQVTEEIAKANMLCVPDKDGLKKTSKLILAVIFGQLIVTEGWIAQSTRSGKLLPPGAYQPNDKSRELEWGVKLPTALNQGLCSDADLDVLFLGCKIYLTRQLRDLLLKTSNLDGYIQIAMAMGAKSVNKRLPDKAGGNKIVLGIDGDYDASAVGKLGLMLYDKDLLPMSALRGRKEDDKEEFRIEIPVKEEPLSQS